jgi:hypothetical protein
MHIVIITYDWLPRNAVSVHRPYSWAKYWAEQGLKVTVLTAVKQSFDAPLDLVLPKLPISVIEVPYGRGGRAIGKLFESSSIRSVAKRFKTFLAKKLKIMIDPRAPWHLAAKPYALQLARDTDFVISTYAPASAHLLAMDMKKANPKLKWIADYRDLWSQSHIAEIPNNVRNLMREEEISSVGLYADQITAVSQDMVARLSNLLRKPVIKITNGFDIDESEVRARFSRPFRKISDPLRIVYTGIIYRGHQNPKPLCDAILKLLQSNQIVSGAVTIDFYGDRLEVADELSKQSDFSPFIRLMGHVNRDTALEAQRSAGLLLLMESSQAQARGVLTGKLFEYIFSGRPVLCLGSHPEYEIGQLLRQTGTGIVIGPDETETLPGVLLKLIKEPSYVDWYKPNIDALLEYSRRKQALHFLSKVVMLGHAESL